MAKSKKKSAKKPAAKKVAPKKAAPKKVVAKKPVKKVAKKSATKKTAAPTKKAAPKKPAQKVIAKKVAVKKVAKAPLANAKTDSIKMTSAKPFAAPPKKSLDLSKFVTPLDDRVLVQLAEAEKMTAGGLYIPDTVSDVSGNLQGLVVSVGRGRRDKKGRMHPMDVKVGDKVVFAEDSGSKIKIQEQDLFIIREADVLGVVG